MPQAIEPRHTVVAQHVEDQRSVGLPELQSEPHAVRPGRVDAEAVQPVLVRKSVCELLAEKCGPHFAEIGKRRQACLHHGLPQVIA